jgi:26S proteasome regulatory subunit N7
MSDEAEIKLNMSITPPLSIPRLQFLYSQPNLKEKDETKDKIIAVVQKNNMVNKYLQLCDLFGWKKDDVWVVDTSKANEEKLNALDAKIEDAEKNFGETEVREANLAKAEFLCRVGTKEEAESAFRVTSEKTVSLGQRLDIALTLIRLGFYYSDQDLIKRNIAKAKSMIEEGGDWDRRNRLKIYEGFHFMSIRNFQSASTLFLEALASFTADELFEFKTLVYYIVITGLLSLDRVTLQTKIIDSPEVLSVLYNFPSLERMLTNFFESEYKGFFLALAEITEEMKFDEALHPHVSYFSREMRVKAYRQYLSSYSSVKLKSMASAFGVTGEYIDRELERFVSAGKIDCRIDAVGGIITTTRPDTKNAQYSQTVKQGDHLLNRIQKLSRVIHL